MSEYAYKHAMTLVTAPHPALTAVAKPVPDVCFGDAARLGQRMIEVCQAHGGIGLAANQVGETIRVIVVDVPGDKTHPPSSTRKPTIMINPRVITAGITETVQEEGCLSHPGAKVLVTRRERVRVSFIDENGKQQSWFVGGLLARCVQHEVDHLNGVSIVDKQL